MPESTDVDLYTDSRTTHLSHLQAPFVGDGSASNARVLAAAYLAQFGTHYGLTSQHLAALDEPIADAEQPGVGSELRFVSSKALLGVNVVSYAQTARAVPVWGRGVAVTVLDGPRRVTSSYSTFDAALSVVPRLPSDVRVGRLVLNAALLRTLLGLDAATNIRLGADRQLAYVYDPADWRRLAALRRDRPVGERPGPDDPTPNPAPVPGVIVPGQPYVVTEGIVRLGYGERGGINWRVFIEPDTRAVLMAEPLVASACGRVLARDPVSLTGDASLGPCSDEATLDALANEVTLRALEPAPPGAPQALHGPHVVVADFHLPDTAPPVVDDGTFDFGARTAEFAAVCAYHHCDDLFQMLARCGLPVSSVLPGIAFPVDVDHCDGERANAYAYADDHGSGVERFGFGLARGACDDGRPAVGIAADRRVVLHEFSHAVLFHSIHRAQLGFAHSGGDALAAILCDPGSRAPDRGLTFPWLPGWPRRHDLPVRYWAWRGVNQGSDYVGEQVLATTLFRAYFAAGGDAGSVPAQEAAAQAMASLIVRALWSFSAAADPPSLPEQFATALTEADLAGTRFHDWPGGLLHKVIRWSFERQGLYQPPGAPVPVVTPGAPPPVDVYIDDGRGGVYEGTVTPKATPGIWSEPRPDGARPGPTADLYVEVRNRGTAVAKNALVRVFTCHSAADHLWPDGWKPLTETRLAAAVPPRGRAVTGPFPWRPPSKGHACVLAYVSAVGDPSNADPGSLVPCALGSVRADLLARLDNNVAIRNFSESSGLANHVKPRG